MNAYIDDMYRPQQAQRPAPMPVAVTVYASVRRDKPVAVLAFTDAESETLELQLSPLTATHLMSQLAQFIEQINTF